MLCGARSDTRSRNIKPSRTGIAEAAERLNTGQKCEGATGSLAILAPGHGPSHPRRLHHGSRLPAISRVGPQALWKARKAVGWFLFRQLTLQDVLIAVSSATTRPSPSLITKLPSSPAAISEQACTVASFSVENERLVY